MVFSYICIIKQLQMKLVIMTKSTFFVEEDKILASLFDEGMDNLHLFKPGSSPIYSERLLTLLPKEFYKSITVHEHYYLNNEYRLGGIHLDIPTETPPKGFKGQLGRTCSDLSMLRQMKKESNYIFLKNIFDCIEFPNEKSNFNLLQLEEAAKAGLIDKKVYALGGMNLERIRIAKDLGFGGVVICGDLWNRFNIHNQIDFKELIGHFQRLRKATN